MWEQLLISEQNGSDAGKERVGAKIAQNGNGGTKWERTRQKAMPGVAEGAGPRGIVLEGIVSIARFLKNLSCCSRGTHFRIANWIRSIFFFLVRDPTVLAISFSVGEVESEPDIRQEDLFST
ncbi:hypothetical protein QR680_013174 [Steinernema hermaphroditum]|uniref:Uncharacterized protein n=1 Tax=Steinernema hermaphroditum TaxID=289476 RepID=A0AA39I7E9_9BILA|nr:hypothetical protein QR680_013174 [Steinernema hermaphroditum]